MIESFALGLRLHPDLFVVQREELWASCGLYVPLNSILNLRALCRERRAGIKEDDLGGPTLQ